MRPYKDKEENFEKVIGGLTVKGKFLPSLDGLQVSVYYKDKDDNVCLVNNEIMGRCNTAYPFGYIPRYESEHRARGLLIFGMDPGANRLGLIVSLSAPTAEPITFSMDVSPEVVEENRTAPTARGIRRK